jgi:antitoxin (DNA-binding transcriptional repressor) of toxin-antitoxin stability system
MARHISSEKARANWRELLDAVAGGDTVIIERYGRPVAALTPHREESTNSVREPAPGYDVDSLNALKEEIASDVTARILEIMGPPLTWAEGLTLLQKQVAEAGGLGFGDDPEAIVEQMRKTRQEIFEAEYAHLYR